MLGKYNLVSCKVQRTKYVAECGGLSRRLEDFMHGLSSCCCWWASSSSSSSSSSVRILKRKEGKIFLFRTPSLLSPWKQVFGLSPYTHTPFVFAAISIFFPCVCSWLVVAVFASIPLLYQSTGEPTSQLGKSKYTVLHVDFYKRSLETEFFLPQKNKFRAGNTNYLTHNCPNQFRTKMRPISML